MLVLREFYPPNLSYSETLNLLWWPLPQNFLLALITSKLKTMRRRRITTATISDPFSRSHSSIWIYRVWNLRI